MQPASDFSQVIFISPGGRFQGGGLGTMTREMEAGLKAFGKKTRVLNTRSEGSVLRSLYETPIALLAFLALIVAEKRTVVHVQLTQRLSLVREGMFVPLARLFGKRVVLHHHGAEFPDFVETASPLWRRITRTVCRAADANIVLGELWASVLRKKLDVEDRKVVLVQNSIRVPAEWPERTYQQHPTRLLLLGNLTPRKGIREALLALQQLREAGDDVRLTLAGGGMIEHYQAFAGEIGVEQHCDFAGWVDRAGIQTPIGEADILIAPSHHEGFPMSIIEAFAANLPVITTPVGAIPELLSDEADCLFVPVGDHAALATAVARLIHDPELRQADEHLGRMRRRTC